MNNFYNLYQLLSENLVFSCVAVGIFLVFICGITQTFLYITSSRSAFLFDSPQISNYLDKTVSPEPIRLKILFLSFPKNEKQLLSSYLQAPEEKPTKVFARTLEQLKCDILARTDYNKNIAIFFFLLSGVAILSSNIQTIEVKILGMFAVALALYLTDLICYSIYVVVKYFSYLLFKKATFKLDDFHTLLASKYKMGYYQTQTSGSPFLKDAMQTLKNDVSTPFQKETSKTPPDISVYQKRAQQCGLSAGLYQPPQFQNEFSQNIERKNDTATNSMKISPTEKVENTQTIDTTSETKIAQTSFINHPDITCEDLLAQIKLATDTLDFEKFGELSAKLSSLISSGNLSQEDHQTLQNSLDAYLDEFREIEEKGIV